MSDRAVDILGAVRAKRADVFARFAPDRLNGCSPADVRRVLVIDAASRSGSSVLHHLLARHPDVVSLNGENLVFEKLHGFGLVESERDCDLIPPDAEGLAAVAEDVLKDAGLACRPYDGFVTDCIQRVILQYPEIDFSVDELRVTFSAAGSWPDALARLGARWPVSAAHYDLRGSDPAAAFPEASNRRPPPFADFCLEEPPFVAPQRRRMPSRLELAQKTLLLKSSSNCYHLPALKAMFPNAEFKFVVLARNPAGAISGLMDGWLSDGFYSRDAGRVVPLDIAGYSDPARPWTRRWWNFDLPPGWAAYRRKTLQEVCAFQWASANEHILRDLADKTIGSHLLVRYEDFLDGASLCRQLDRILSFAGLPGSLPGGAPASVMSVTPPAPQKWRKRRDAVAPLMADARVRALARELGYEPDAWETWA